MKPHLRIVGAPSAQFDVDSRIPIPSRYSRAQYPWDSMRVGDSFFVPGEKRESMAVRSAARYRAAKTGERYTVRKKDNGVRVWRVK